jgi:hypothetical protein
MRQRPSIGWLRPQQPSASRAESFRATTRSTLLSFWIWRSLRCCAAWCGRARSLHRVPKQPFTICSTCALRAIRTSCCCPRIWQRHNLAAYDAAYVVLAEKLGATLLTRDPNSHPPSAMPQPSKSCDSGRASREWVGLASSMKGVIPKPRVFTSAGEGPRAEHFKTDPLPPARMEYASEQSFSRSGPGSDIVVYIPDR